MIEAFSKVAETTAVEKLGSAASELSKQVASFDTRIESTREIVAGEFKGFNPDKRVDVSEKNDFSNSKYNPDSRIEKNEETKPELYTTSKERIDFASNGDGEWTGAPGNSEFIPNKAEAKEALDRYNQTGIEYSDGNPDFTKVSESTVKIDDMTSNRNLNFKQADVKCAEKWNAESRDGRTDWTGRDVSDWRSENRYSWHERVDRATMDLVQRDIHEECKHFGGVAECKRAERVSEIGGGFDE